MPPPLIKKIRAIRRRLLWLEFCRKFLVLLKWGGLLLLVFLVVSRLFPLPVGLQEAGRWVAAGGGALLLAWSILRPVRLFDAALRTDAQLGLKERLSSALLIRVPRTEPEQAVVRDATEHAARIEPERVFRADLGKDVHWGAAALTAIFLVWWFMPQFDLLARKQREEERKRVQAVAVETKKEAARRLEDLAREIEQTSELRKPAVAGQLQKDLEALARKLEEEKIPPERALANVTRMQDRLAARKAEIEKRLAMPSAVQTKGLGKHMQDIDKALKQGNFRKAAQLLNDLKTEMQGGTLSEQEKKGIQEELKMMAAQMGEDSRLSKALAEASAKMGEGQLNAALADLEDAADSMLDLEAMLKELEALESLEYDLDARNLALAGMPMLCDGCTSGST
jgi:hypothetical protein